MIFDTHYLSLKPMSAPCRYSKVKVEASRPALYIRPAPFITKQYPALKKRMENNAQHPTTQ